MIILTDYQLVYFNSTTVIVEVIVLVDIIYSVAFPRFARA